MDWRGRREKDREGMSDEQARLVYEAGLDIIGLMEKAADRGDMSILSEGMHEVLCRRMKLYAELDRKRLN